LEKVVGVTDGAQQAVAMKVDFEVVRTHGGIESDLVAIMGSVKKLNPVHQDLLPPVLRSR
jgi:hypothetical protein